MVIGLNHRKKVEENLCELKKLIKEIEETGLNDKCLNEENLIRMHKLNYNLYSLEHFGHQIRSASSMAIKKTVNENNEVLAKIY